MREKSHFKSFPKKAFFSLLQRQNWSLENGKGKNFFGIVSRQCSKWQCAEEASSRLPLSSLAKCNYFFNGGGLCNWGTFLRRPCWLLLTDRANNPKLFSSFWPSLVKQPLLARRFFPKKLRTFLGPFFMRPSIRPQQGTKFIFGPIRTSSFSIF